jgi:hypothetical protein
MFEIIRIITINHLVKNDSKGETPMITIQEQFIRFLKQEDIHWIEVRKGHLYTGFRGDNGAFETNVIISEKQQYVLVQASCSLKIPEHKKMGIAQLVAHFNFKLAFGQFVYDSKSGIVGFRTCSLSNQSLITDDICKQLLFGNWTMIDSRFPIFAQAVYGDLNVEEYCHKNSHEMKLKESKSSDSNDTTLYSDHDRFTGLYEKYGNN